MQKLSNGLRKMMEEAEQTLLQQVARFRINFGWVANLLFEFKKCTVPWSFCTINNAAKKCY